MSISSKVLVSEEILPPYSITNWAGGNWASKWVEHPLKPSAPYVMAFRCFFELEQDRTMRIHVSGDERYELFLDGERIGRGPERGDLNHWFFETYDWNLKAGRHVVVARVTVFGFEETNFAQFSIHPGFWLMPHAQDELPLLATGIAPWHCKVLGGYGFTSKLCRWGADPQLVIQGNQFDWGFERGEGSGWTEVGMGRFGVAQGQSNENDPRDHPLTPAILPAMFEQPWRRGWVRHVEEMPLSQTHAVPVLASHHLPEEGHAWQALASGHGAVTLPPHTRRRIILDLEDYVCAHVELVTSQGAGGFVRIHWQEALYSDSQKWGKGNRDEIEGKFFNTIWNNTDGVGDIFHPDGKPGRKFETLWWRTGRYVEILAEAGNHPLVLEKLFFHETHYPVEMESRLDMADEKLHRIVPITKRVLQMCSHETFMDCPYYEQLMYVGDTRIECLTTYAIQRDDRLPRKALQLFDWSRTPDGLTASRYPSKIRQIIPPFSLWWVCMVWDHVLWRGDRELARSLRSGVHSVLNHFSALFDGSGLARSPEGWNYVDWVDGREGWKAGVPPHSTPGHVSGLVNWQLLLAFQAAEKLEGWCGEPELAELYHRCAAELFSSLWRTCWDGEAGLFQDAPGIKSYSEHSQFMAVLSGLMNRVESAHLLMTMGHHPDITPTSTYFDYYHLETVGQFGLMDLFHRRLGRWHEMVDLGFKTTYENGSPDTVRSDCHAWGAHPLLHFLTTILGIKPDAPGFSKVRIRPNLGLMPWAKGSIVHPMGEVSVDFYQAEGRILGQVSLPPETPGVLEVNGMTWEIAPGATMVI